MVAIVECNNCFTDGIQAVTGCTFGNNALIFQDLGKTAVTVASLGQYFRVFPLTRFTLGLGLGVALVVGLLAAIFPAWRAARVSIAEALRKIG
ncbi:MAG: FmdE family protein [Deltaproteobacteria bacterium]|nr:FmdE family protein [Deltaproteobacteria bacterium]